MSERFTAGRVPDAGITALFTTEARWQAWLAVEAALSQTQAALGLIPEEAAAAITEGCSSEWLDTVRIREGIARSSHPLMPLILELSRVVGEPHSAWIHWGATTQNVTQTGDVLVLRQAHTVILKLLSRTLEALADLADRSAEMVMPGRTHGQHAVPITFGFKAASWIDEFGRHGERLQEIEPRLFRALIGGAAGTFASLGAQGKEVQAGVAERLGLMPTPVPSRSALDAFAEFACVLGLLAATCGKIGREIYSHMKTEYGEVEEPVPAGTIGSSTMPQKRNPQLCQDVIGMSAEVRALVPLALETAISEHEADNQPSVMFDALMRGCSLMGDVLARVNLIVGDLRLNPERMRANLALSGGTISAEAIMLELGRTLGRQEAHEVVYQAAQRAATEGVAFLELLRTDPRITTYLEEDALKALLEPEGHVGLSATLAREQAKVARQKVLELNGKLDTFQTKSAH